MMAVEGQFSESSRIEEELLREGAKSYRLAIAAIREYQALVMRRCREVVASERDRITKILGTSPEPLKDLQEFQATTQYAAIGVRTVLSGGSKQTYALWWQADRLYASLWTTFKNSESAQRAKTGLQDAHGADRAETVGSNSTEIWLRLELKPEHTAQPWDQLTKCIVEWHDTWSRVPGGLRQYM
jgi:hypothetical protein